MDGGVVCSGRVLLERELRAGEGGRREGERGWSGRVGLERVGKGDRSWRVKVGLERLVGAEEEGWSWTGVVWPAPGGTVRLCSAVHCSAEHDSAVRCRALRRRKQQEAAGGGRSPCVASAAGGGARASRRGLGACRALHCNTVQYNAAQCRTVRRVKDGEERPRGRA